MSFSLEKSKIYNFLYLKFIVVGALINRILQPSTEISFYYKIKIYYCLTRNKSFHRSDMGSGQRNCLFLEHTENLHFLKWMECRNEDRQFDILPWQAWLRPEDSTTRMQRITGEFKTQKVDE